MQDDIGATGTVVAAASGGIQAEGLRRWFGQVAAVDGVTFSAPSGAVTALIGPNGSGKTTLLLILAGLLKPDSGLAAVAGHDVVADNLAARSHVGWMPDVFGTWDALTCQEILSTFGRAHGLSKQDAKRRGLELLDWLYLAEFADRPARVLSRGQKQRLGLARALVHDPPVLLLDEPASGLDPRSRVELRRALRNMASVGKTVLVSSHVLSELEEVYDHAVFLSRGRTISGLGEGPVAPKAAAGGWRVAALDPVGLREFLDRAGVPYESADARGEVVVSLSGPESAAELVRAAVGAGVLLHTVVPLVGRLEQAYLSLDEERA
ncbi:MAG: ABC transporter ATP-binding protein [Propionibacteriaceae bacterium]|jgi:ABC-type multidrug transport system ATPase subunit|nr:ABC transporter ATP-binding protein [Propionibacteriaceae bacterium]